MSNDVPRCQPVQREWTSVLCGIDGTPGAEAAQAWAAGEAVRHGAGLQLLHAVRIPAVADGHAHVPGDRPRTTGGRLAADAARPLAQRFPALSVTGFDVDDEPGHALVEGSRTADLTVIGTRRRGRLLEALLGSVALEVVAHARSPVAVVGRPHDDRTGPVVVAADGTARSDAAVAFAFSEAASRNCELVAIVGWDELGHRLYERRPGGFGLPDADTGEELLGAQLADWRGRCPHVAVRSVVYFGPVADALTRADTWGGPPAQLIVLGSRGRGAVAGLLLGSTAHTVISDPPCPVVIVRPDVAARPEMRPDSPAATPVRSAGGEPLPLP